MAASRISVLHIRTGGRRKWLGPGQIICARAPSDPRGTDEAVHRQTIDDMEIPELGFADDTSADNDWQREGLLAARNVVPEQYVLHALVLPVSGTAPGHG
jgi:hypothetical protein